MVQVLKIQVYYSIQCGPNLDDRDNRVCEETPTSQEPDDIKLDIGRIIKHQIIPLSPLPEYAPYGKILWYYVVLKTKSNQSTIDNKGNKGKVGYRTVVPKILL